MWTLFLILIFPLLVIWELIKKYWSSSPGLNARGFFCARICSKLRYTRLFAFAGIPLLLFQTAVTAQIRAFKRYHANIAALQPLAAFLLGCTYSKHALKRAVLRFVPLPYILYSECISNAYIANLSHFWRITATFMDLQAQNHMKAAYSATFQRATAFRSIQHITRVHRLATCAASLSPHFHTLL